MRQWLNRSLGEQGTALMEAGIIFPFLLLSYVGIVGLAQYLDTHRNIFETANQVATAYSLEREGKKDVLDTIAKYANIVTSPDDVAVSYAFCGISMSSPGVIVTTSPPREGTLGKGICGKGSATSSYIEKAKCPAVSPGPNYGQFVVVTTSCRYNPSFNFFGLLNMPMSTTVSIPFREFVYVVP